MKKIILSLIVGVATIGAKAQMHHDHPAVHGMLVVGTKTVYLSHLPMFHSPHDYQVILEVELDPMAMQTYIKNKMHSQETVYTIVPQVFVLPAMVQNPKPFVAQLFKGHFERGGVMIAPKVQVSIKKVVFFKKLQASENKPSVASYLLFGNQEEQFIAHYITGKPDFDQILQVQLDMGTTRFFTSAITPVGLIFPGFKNQPFAAPQILKAQVVGKSSTLNLKIVKSLYLEFGDLGM